MTISIRRGVCAALFCLASVTAAPAAVLIEALETSGNVTFTISGSWDVSQATFVTSETSNPASSMRPNQGSIAFDNFGFRSRDVYRLTSASSFGTSGLRNPDSWTGGEVFALFGGSLNLLIVPQGQLTGTISRSMTFNNASFASLGLTEGTHTFAWTGDSATLRIGPAPTTPVPLPATLPLLAAALAVGAALGIRRRRG